MIKLTAKNYDTIIQRQRRTWPKYSTQLMNIASQNCKATSPKNVGSMKELWLQMRHAGIRGTLENWTNFYNQQKGQDTLTIAGQKIYDMLIKMSIHNITIDMAIEYVKEVVYNKTQMGLGGEEMAVQVVADYYNAPYKFSTAEEETAGIDAWIGDYPVQVKPHDSVFKAHVHNHADMHNVLFVTYETKKQVCYIHNPEFIYT